jgi:hypothetical protein
MGKRITAKITPAQFQLNIRRRAFAARMRDKGAARTIAKAWRESAILEGRYYNNKLKREFAARMRAKADARRREVAARRIAKAWRGYSNQ